MIIANFCRDFSETDNGRFMYLCKALSKEHNVEIITSDYSHITKKHKGPLRHNWPFTITFVHEIGYRKNISVQRFISHWLWGRKVAEYLKKREKPDVIYCAVPSLTAPYEAAKYSEKKGVRYLIDIQDLWPEAFQMVFSVPILSNLFFSPFKHIADEIYKRADAVCGVSRSYVNRGLGVNKTNKNGHVVYLGTSIQIFDENVANNNIQKDKGEIWIGYCGSLNTSYDLTIVFDALFMIKKKKYKVPKFIILGAGEKKESFEEYANRLELDTKFTGRLPYDQMCGWLAACDFAVNPIMHNASQSIINKHGDYAAAGIPVISTQENDEYRELVEKYEMGFNVSNRNAEELAEKIILLMNDENLRRTMGSNARKCAEEKFDRNRTYGELINVILGESE